MNNLAKALAVAAALSSASGINAQGNPNLVGKWTWTRPTNNCTETYEFRSDGVALVTSGAEKTENRYSIAFSADKDGFYAMTITTTKDYGGKDCANSDDDSTGQTSTVYLKFHPTGNAHISCYEPNTKRCFGPIRRVPQ